MTKSLETTQHGIPIAGHSKHKTFKNAIKFALNITILKKQKKTLNNNPISY